MSRIYLADTDFMVSFTAEGLTGSSSNATLFPDRTLKQRPLGKRSRIRRICPPPSACPNLHAHPPPSAPAYTKPMKLIEPRPVPLGGLRAMTVRRLLPSRDRRMVGAWCFIDHYGPDDVAVTGGMRVAPHPHTGLQTASWIFTGTIEHRDSLGTVADVRPGELNLMTAGYGINHSEYSTPDTTVLHGIQLWIALPRDDMNTAPAFENFVPEALTFGGQGSGQDASAPAGVQARVFLGELGVTVDGETKTGSSPVTTFSPLLGAEILVGAPGSDPRADKNPAEDAPRRTLTLTLNPEFEHGFVVDTGALLIKGQRVAADEMLFIEPGTEELTIEAIGATRLILLGGTPFGEKNHHVVELHRPHPRRHRRGPRRLERPG